MPSLWNMKKNQDPKADDIYQLMYRYSQPRDVYIDNIILNRAGTSVFYSPMLLESDGLNIPLIYIVSSIIQLL